jgi:hypothetical protein
MTLKSDQGCGTPQDATRKQVHMRLAELFAPLVYFEPEERFFPVDLPATIQNSSLWRTDPTAQPPTTQREKDFGTINPVQDLVAATANHYTTVAGTGAILKKVTGQPPFNMPVPLLNEIHQKYKDGLIPAELTLYATVCSARDVPNSHLISHCADKDVAHGLSEGLIINYYMYFPACESPEFESEGDWAGISLLLRETPTQLAQLSSAAQINRFLPVMACYYHKTLEAAPPSPSFVAGSQGFRRWKDVKRGPEPSVGQDTHPFVYLSRGRHNCYYEPVTTTIKLLAPWESTFTADRIESGAYAAGPAEKTLQGGGIEEFPWWGYLIFPPFALLTACGTGCEYPVHFDSSGVPAGYEEGEDRAKAGGYHGLPGSQGSTYPQTSAVNAPSPAQEIGLRLRYVDLDDPTTAGLWGYAGAWGGASLLKATPVWDPQNPLLWGYYRGARRPALAAWFVWNLFLDSTFGCGGTPQLTRSPWS